MSTYPCIAVVTYNDFPLYENGIHLIETVSVLIAGKTFSTKNPDDIHSENQEFKHIYLHKDTLRYIVIFIGKKSSGSLEIIDIFCKVFGQEKCFFVLCHHDSQEKFEQLLYYYNEHTIAFHCKTFTDPRVIKDPSLRCDESMWLLEVMHECIDKIYIESKKGK